CPATPIEHGFCGGRRAVKPAPVLAFRPLGQALATEETVGWTTFGCGARRFGVRGQAKCDPALARSAWGSGAPKRRRRRALPAHSKGPACRLSSGLLCRPAQPEPTGAQVSRPAAPRRR